MPLVNYTSITEDIDNTLTTFLVMKNTDEIVQDVVKVNAHENFLNNQTLKRIEIEASDASCSQQKKYKPCQLFSIEIKDKFIVEIGEVKYRQLIRGLKGNIYLRMSIYHGNVEITKSVDTLVRDILRDEQELPNDKQKKSKCVEFDIAVCNIPRNGRLCCGLYLRDKRGKTLALGWANRTIFNYNGIMRQRHGRLKARQGQNDHLCRRILFTRTNTSNLVKMVYHYFIPSTLQLELQSVHQIAESYFISKLFLILY